jgi:mannose/cellobiose epimerase-like protein (N-acyl-D-glucosamine 2-epimerase family)
MASRPRTLIEPGHETEWSRLDAEKRRALIPPPETPIAELLRRGQHLSAQAGGLLRAVERADHASRS